MSYWADTLCAPLLMVEATGSEQIAGSRCSMRHRLHFAVSSLMLLHPNAFTKESPANAEPVAPVAGCYVDLEEFTKECDLDAKVQHGSRSFLDESTPGGLGMTSHDAKTNVVQAGAALDSIDILSENVGGSHCSLEDYVGTNLGLDTASGSMDQIEGSQDVMHSDWHNAIIETTPDSIARISRNKVDPQPQQLILQHSTSSITWSAHPPSSPAVVMGWDTVVATMLFVLPVLCFIMAEADCLHSPAMVKIFGGMMFLEYQCNRYEGA
ncbi:hypothetical protein Nepgr_016441 [Nepenthes gracilis]|uniref:Uncharacterized protein n=1 Tax=Nepenthes gracilis TaxID=150966 RepID=A0AAD3SMN2_NEPGR|nr:hypothetical protein Nepgr_016441 [Nepenthes gracilis]